MLCCCECVSRCEWKREKTALGLLSRFLFFFCAFLFPVFFTHAFSFFLRISISGVFHARLFVFFHIPLRFKIPTPKHEIFHPHTTKFLRRGSPTIFYGSLKFHFAVQILTPKHEIFHPHATKFQRRGSPTIFYGSLKFHFSLQIPTPKHEIFHPHTTKFHKSKFPTIFYGSLKFHFSVQIPTPKHEIFER